MIKKVLKCFPEVVIIQELDRTNNQSIIKFANDVAKSELLTYPDPEELPISDDLINLRISILDENMEILEDNKIDSLTTILISESKR